jgi:hypothetical protein
MDRASKKRFLCKVLGLTKTLRYPWFAEYRVIPEVFFYRLVAGLSLMYRFYRLEAGLYIAMSKVGSYMGNHRHFINQFIYALFVTGLAAGCL